MTSKRIYLSVDFEGLAGVSSMAHLGPGSPFYSDAREAALFLVKEVVATLREAGVEPLVADSHGSMVNLRYVDLDAQLIQGFPRPIAMVAGIEGASAAIFLGYHAAAGTPSAFFDHTVSSAAIHRVTLDGELVGETTLNALYAGEHGVPIALVAGDEALWTELKKFVPWAVFVPLKRALSRYSALSLSLSEARRTLRSGVEEALRRLKEGSLRPLKLEWPRRLRVELRDPGLADLLVGLRGVERIDGYTLELEVWSAREALIFIELAALAHAGLRKLVEIK
ncbi:MAG: M55 family metallopeptidase [Fervidicoccaceae archaeon]